MFTISFIDITKRRSYFQQVMTNGCLHIQADLIPRDGFNIFKNQTSQLSKYLLQESAKELLDRKTKLCMQVARYPASKSVGAEHEIFIRVNINK